jgi:PKD repeat protein
LLCHAKSLGQIGVGDQNVAFLSLKIINNHKADLQLACSFEELNDMKKSIGTVMGVLFLSMVLGLTLNVRIVQSAGDWWPMFHHDLAHTGYSSSTAPATNQTLWTYTTGASVGSSPAVVNGTVYFGSYDHKVYAVNASTGAQVWNYTTGETVESSPAVVDGVVYVGANDNKTYALNAATGALIWNYTTGRYVTSSPAVSDGVVCKRRANMELHNWRRNSVFTCHRRR